MAYRRNYQRRYRRRYRRRYYRKKPTTLAKYSGYVNTAYRAFNLAKKVARMVNVEYKWIPIEISHAFYLPNSILKYTLNAVPVGDGVNARDGDSIKMIRFSCRGHIELPTVDPAIGIAHARFRVIIANFKQGAHAFLTIDEVLDTVNYPQTEYVDRPKNPNTRFDSKFLLDKVYTMDIQKSNILNFSYNYKLYGHTNYVAGTDQPTTNELIMFIITDKPTASSQTYTPICKIAGKFSYTDN